MEQKQTMMLVVLLATMACVWPTASGQIGVAITTDYWNCCKDTCSSAANTGTLAAGSTPVATCGADGTTVVAPATASSCSGGTAYKCTNQQPLVINATLAYAFASANVYELPSQSSCCACYQLKFIDLRLAGKSLIVQVTNTGRSLIANEFDIQIPGSGIGLIQSCRTQYGSTVSNWGYIYGGVATVADCANLPAPLQVGCQFRFGFLEGVSNPSVAFSRVKCPAQLAAITGCNRADDA